jgi:hypothetical protein
MNFLIIAQPQTEMHLLADILEGHPEISLPELNGDERLNKLFTEKKLQGKMSKSYLLHSSFNSYLSKTASHKCTGYLTDCNSALSNNLPHIFKHMNKSVKVILLKRKNTLQQYVNLLMNEEHKSVHCDEKEFFAFYKKLELSDIDTKIELDRLYIPYMDIYYENLCNNLCKELEALKEYLGVKQAFNKPTECFVLEKIPLKQHINNFTSFYETFKDTRFNVFF